MTDTAAVPSAPWSQRLAALGGPTVADTAIRLADGADTVSLGGLTLRHAVLASCHDRGTNITVPPTWPVLAVVQLDHRTHTSSPTFGLAVLEQAILVTDPDRRASLVDHGFRVARHHGSAVVHRSELTDASTGVTCWTEVRHGVRRRGLGPSHRAVLMFAGREIASSGIIVWGPPSFDGVPQIAGDLVESACGARPDGL